MCVADTGWLLMLIFRKFLSWRLSGDIKKRRCADGSRLLPPALRDIPRRLLTSPGRFVSVAGCTAADCVRWLVDKKCSFPPFSVASHADILFAHHAIFPPQKIAEERLRDEPKECLRGRLPLLLRRQLLFFARKREKKKA